jgi:hypothetical protein
MRASRVISILGFFVGLLLVLQGLLGMVAPDAFVGVVRYFQSPSVVYVAAALRIAIGIVLLCAATGSRLPSFLRVFGVLIVIGGVLTPFVGVQFAHTILALWASRGPGLVRLFAAVSLALGLFTAYAISPKRLTSRGAARMN